MPDEVLLRKGKFCKDCRYSTMSSRRMFCLKNHMNRTFVYETCDKYDEPEEVYKDDIQIWRYL